MSEARRLADAVRELGAACAALSNKGTGAESVLHEFANAMSQIPESSQLASEARSAGKEWATMEAETKAAAVAAHRFAADLA